MIYLLILVIAATVIAICWQWVKFWVVFIVCHPILAALSIGGWALRTVLFCLGLASFFMAYTSYAGAGASGLFWTVLSVVIGILAFWGFRTLHIRAKEVY